MRHHNANRKFGRQSDERQAMFRSLAQAIVVREKIKTTEPKAKEIRPFVEKLVTRSKNPTLATKRFLITQIGAPAAKKLVDVIAPKMKERAGGYTRIIKLGARKSDGANMAIIEFV